MTDTISALTTEPAATKLKRLLLRYYPPGILLEYKQADVLKLRAINLLDFHPQSDIDKVTQDIIASEKMIPSSKAAQVYELLSRVRDKHSVARLPKYELVKTLRTHLMPLTNCVFTKSGDRFITGSYDRLCKVWDTETGLELQSLEGHKNVVYALSFNHPFSDKIATGSFDKTAKIWDSYSGKCLHTLGGHSEEVVCLTFNPNSTLLATGSMDSLGILWDVRSGNEIRRFKGHSGEIVSISFNQEGSLALTGSFDSTLNIWDMRSNSYVIEYTYIFHCFCKKGLLIPFTCLVY
ncbi:Dynein assembly factor with WDR repeat domains 1 [Batrachochytrium dendrobatidis]